jgi:hypothetical protein
MQKNHKSEKIHFEGQIHNFLHQVPPDLLPDDSAGMISRELWWMNQEFSMSTSFRRGSPYSYIAWRLKNRPVGGCSSET